MSLISLSSGISRNLQRLSFNERPKQLHNAEEGASLRGEMARGARGFATGVWDGLSGIVTSPVRQTRTRGLAGIPIGIGQGALF